MKRNKIKLFDIEIDSLSMEDTVQLVDYAIQNKQQFVHNSINAGKVVLMQKDTALLQSLREADILSADGQSIVWASKLFGNSLPERVPGIDLMHNLMTLAEKKGYQVFLFGAKDVIIKKVVEHFGKNESPNIIAGYRNGYYSPGEETAIVNAINDSEAELVFVAIPSPQKELFISKYRDKLTNVSFLMGVGGSFDVIAGAVNRAPVWMQNWGLEWFYRLIQEPKKMWRRYLIGNFTFITLVVRHYLNRGK